MPLQTAQPGVPLGADVGDPGGGARRGPGGATRSASRGRRAAGSARPASWSTARCFATAWRVIGNSRAISLAVTLPRSAIMPTSCRRVGSASALKAAPERLLVHAASASVALPDPLDHVDPGAAADGLDGDLHGGTGVVVAVVPGEHPAAGRVHLHHGARARSAVLLADDHLGRPRAGRARPRGRASAPAPRDR